MKYACFLSLQWLLVTLAWSSFQVRTCGQTSSFYSKLVKERVPKEILASVQEDFPGMEIVDISGLPVGLIDNTWYLDPHYNPDVETYGSYLLTLSGNGHEMNVTYGKEGNLLNSTEQRKNNPLPSPVQASLKKQFPGWTITQDHLLITHYQDGKKKTHYKIWLKKGEEFRKIILDANGNLVDRGR